MSNADLDLDILLPARARAKAFFDLAAMKRRFGPPPLFGQSEESFDEFMRSLASCFEIGDSIIATSLYQFGLEQFKKMAVFRWRSESIRRNVSLIRQKDDPETYAKKVQKRRREQAMLNKDCLELCYDIDSTCFTLTDDIMGKMDSRFERLGEEMKLSRVIESNLDHYLRIDAFIDQCTKRANEALLRIRMHNVVLAERLDREFNDMAAEQQYATAGHLG